MNKKFWQGRRVLLTGHTGFKGSWLSLWLQSMGADLTGYALHAPTTPSLFEEAKVEEGMISVIGDIRDLSNLQAVFAKHQPEIVIHMAAQSLVKHSYQNPVETYSTNVMGTVHILECVRFTPSVKAVLNVTTDKCYENMKWIWGYRENDPVGGYDPYSNSKACSELVSAGYRSSFFNIDKYGEHGVAIATARSGNVIGGGDWSKNRLIPDILSAFMHSEIAKVRNPNAIRPWQFVMEPLRGYLKLAEYLYCEGPSYSEAWNFGPYEGDAKSVRWISEQISALWGQDARWEVDFSQHEHEAELLNLDITKARGRLDWHPTLRLQVALAMIVDWAKQRNSGANVRELTMNQIKNYQELAS